MEIAILGEHFRGRRVPYEGEEAFRKLSELSDIFVHRLHGKGEDAQVLLVPFAGPADGDDTFSVRDHFSIVARLIEARLVAGLPALELRHGRWGLERVRRDDDLVDSAFEAIGRSRPANLAGIHKHHRTVFRVRYERLPSRGRILFLTVEFRRHQEIEPTIAELRQRGLDLLGLEVFAQGENGRRLWLGRVVSAGQQGFVVAGDEGESTIDGTRAWVEPSSETFRALFEQVLGRDGYARFTEAEWSQRAIEVTGKGYIDRLGGVASYLRKRGEIPVVDGLRVVFRNVVGLADAAQAVKVADATELPAVEYCFSLDRTAIDKYPASGLGRHGPFDGSSFDIKEPRVLVVCPAESQDDVEAFVRQLRDGTGESAKGTFARGLVGTYRLTRLHMRFAPVPLATVSSGVGERYVAALSGDLSTQRPPDIALIVIRDEDAFVERDNPYLAAKAFLLRQGIASQEVRLSKVRAPQFDLPYILRDFAVAVYAKLGGAPWTVRPQMPIAKEVIIGMAHAEFGSRHSTRTRYMGITTVFNGDGNYLLAAGTPRCLYDDYSGELVKSVRDTLTRLARDYAWSPGDTVRLIFHTTKPLTKRDIDAVATEALGAVGPGIQVQSAFLTIEEGHPYKVLAPQEPGRRSFVELLRGGRGQAMVGTCAPRRGLMVDLGDHKRLLCVNGPLLMKREGESIPHPLQIELHRRSTYTDMTALTRQVFHFTGLSWRSMLPVTEPVTTYYPFLIAKMLGRLSALPGWSDDLLDTRLRRSRWFL